MKIALLLLVLVFSGLATLGKAIFPGIETTSNTAQATFGFWTVVVPILLALVLAYHFFRQK
jgi:hypothetical protein